MSNLQDFLEMKKYYLDVIKEKDQRITELEKELAVLKQKYNKVNDNLKNLTEEVENNFVDGQDYEQLKQQLEEKDKEIKEINKNFIQAIHDWKELCVGKDKKIIDLEKIISSMEEQDMTFHNQLAIQELEKVKKWVSDHTQDFWSCENDDLDTELYEFIDNQIKELKGE